MQTRFSDEKSVCLSAVKRVIYDKTKQSYDARILIPHERTFTLVLSQKNGWWGLVLNPRWGQPLLPEILGQTDPVVAKSPIFSRHSLVATQP